MNGMSPEANQLLNAGREAFSPTEADRARLLAALTGTATLSLGVAIGAGAQRSLSGIFGVAHVARLAAVALPVVAAGAYWLHVSAQRTEPARVADPVHHVAPAVAAKATPPTPPEAQISALQAPSEPSAPVSPERSLPALETSNPGNEIRQEVALLSKAQAALSRGRPQEALAALTEHAQRFPHGALSEERAATRVRTLCALGRTREAAAELKRIETVNPTSAYLARARESCAF